MPAIAPNSAATRAKTDYGNFDAKKYHTLTGRTTYPTADGKWYDRIEFYNRITGKQFYAERTTRNQPADTVV